MLDEGDVRQAKEQAREAGPLVLLLLLLKDYGKRVYFSGSSGRFLIDGRPVGVRAVRRLLEKVESVGARRLKKHTQDLFDGRLDVRRWLELMRRDVAASHLLAAALALGTLEEAVASAAVAERVAKERSYLDGFAADLRAQRVSQARGLSRAASYLLAAAVTYAVLDQRVQYGAGRREAKRVRRASESCPGCLRYAGRWLPVEVMPPIGSLDCGSHCRCFLVYR